MFYEGAIYRPPSEAGSLILQITVGCRHNACTFCTMFKDKRFRIKTYEEIEQIIAEARAYYPQAQRIFLADGDALTVDTAVLIKVLDKLYQNFPRLNKVGIYGGPKDILRKSVEELKELKDHGLNIVYLGVESGSARILKAVHKGVTPEEMIAAGQKVMASGLLLSCTVIIGLGGKAHSREHAIETAKVASAINPHYLAGLTLLIDQDALIMGSIQRGELEILSPLECLREIKTLVEHLEVTDCIFRCNHASNYLPLKATLPKEKEKLLSQIDDVLERNQTERLRPETWRAL
ncbi:MAG: radical SAM protein [Desulfitobacteriaceae bacterium]|nr:radical SAM protein [Desulfitobacteriaceae bacterium]MDD4346924.1 radical SAM protein [Desulfitobacteriaceae bacterium]MDD4401952.1 radical SAM protein [Desulfitobacteriaceae bacterium]